MHPNSLNSHNTNEYLIIKGLTSKIFLLFLNTIFFNQKYTYIKNSILVRGNLLKSFFKSYNTL